MRVGLLGLGRWGKGVLLPALDRLCGESGVDLSEPNASLWPKGRSVWLDYHRVLEGDRVQAVVIATPPDTHHQLVKEALLAGKHVFVEKPLALTSQEADFLCDMAEDRGLVLHVDDTWQHHREMSMLLGGGGQANARMHLQWGNPRADLTPEGLLWTLGPHPVSLLLRYTKAKPEDLRLIYHEPREVYFDCPYGSVLLSWRMDRLRAFTYWQTSPEPPYRTRRVYFDDVSIQAQEPPVDVALWVFLHAAEQPPQRRLLTSVDRHAAHVVRALEQVQAQMTKESP